MSINREGVKNKYTEVLPAEVTNGERDTSVRGSREGWESEDVAK